MISKPSREIASRISNGSVRPSAAGIRMFSAIHRCAFQDHRPAEEWLDAEPGRRHRVVPGLQPVELGRRREGRQRSARPRGGSVERLRPARKVALVGGVPLGDGLELAAPSGVGGVSARPVSDDGGHDLEGLPLQDHEAPVEAGRSELAGHHASRAPGRSAQAGELLGQRDQSLAEQQRDAAIGCFVNGHEVRAFPANDGIAVEPHGVSLSTNRIACVWLDDARAP